MTPSRGIFATCLYALLRFSPIAAAYFVLDLSGLGVTERVAIVDRSLRLAVLVAIWSLTEGVCMLWIRKKAANAADSRGYGAVAIIGGVFVLVALQVFRLQSGQHHFLLLLTALAFRGMSRSGWEQRRAHISILTSIVAHALMAMLSFLLALNTLPWPTLMISAAIGALLGSLEAAWHGNTFTGIQHQWVVPTHRISVAFAPLALSTLAFVGGLPPYYAATLVLLPIASRISRRASIERLASGKDLYSISGMYVVFMCILLLCTIYL